MKKKIPGSYECELALLSLVCFFFKAEDGIRDVAVTGVQTCALPISCSPRRSRFPRKSASSSRTRCHRRSKKSFHCDATLGLRGLRRVNLLTRKLSFTAPICRSEEHTSELQSRLHLVCRLLLETKNDDVIKEFDLYVSAEKSEGHGNTYYVSHSSYIYLMDTQRSFVHFIHGNAFGDELAICVHT